MKFKESKSKIGINFKEKKRTQIEIYNNKQDYDFYMNFAEETFK